MDTEKKRFVLFHTKRGGCKSGYLGAEPLEGGGHAMSYVWFIVGVRYDHSISFSLRPAVKNRNSNPSLSTPEFCVTTRHILLSRHQCSYFYSPHFHAPIALPYRDIVRDSSLILHPWPPGKGSITAACHRYRPLTDCVYQRE